MLNKQTNKPLLPPHHHLRLALALRWQGSPGLILTLLCQQAECTLDHTSPLPLQPAVQSRCHLILQEKQFIKNM